MSLRTLDIDGGWGVWSGGAACRRLRAPRVPYLNCLSPRVPRPASQSAAQLPPTDPTSPPSREKISPCRGLLKEKSIKKISKTRKNSRNLTRARFDFSTIFK